MSVDLVVWEGSQPAGDSEAVAAFEELCARFLDAPRSPPANAIANYVSVLVGRYPDLARGDAEGVPWGSGPLIENEDAWPRCVRPSIGNVGASRSDSGAHSGALGQGAQRRFCLPMAFFARGGGRSSVRCFPVSGASCR